MELLSALWGKNGWWKMSILIPNEIMPMPKSCVKCIFMALSMCHVIPRWMDIEMASELYHGRHKKCPLREVEEEVQDEQIH